MMRQIIPILAMTLSISACVLISADATPFQAHDPVDVSAVEVFTERAPDRSFSEIGAIEVRGNHWARSPELIRRAQEEAAKMGATAVIVSRQPIRGAVAGADLDLDLAWAQETENPRVWAIAIRWVD